MLEWFNMKDCNLHATPLPTSIKLTANMELQMEADHQFIADKPYRKLLGSLMWAQVATRPDLSFAVGLLTRFQINPRPAHWNALIHVLGYIKGMLEYKITYTKNYGESIKPVGYVDVDYRGDLDTRCFTAGYMFIMAGGAISWSSKHQNTVVLSTMEAKYMAMTCGAHQALWMHNFLVEDDMLQLLPITLHVDNTSSIVLSESTKEHL